jgi:hypothetical protein
MCAQSQLEISDVAKMVHPGKRGHRIMAVLQFKFDESYNERFMSVAGFIADELEWKKLEHKWQKRIDFENSINRPDQRITRFHAANLNAKTYDFEFWDASMSAEFSSRLIRLLGERRMGAVGISADMDAVISVFPSQDTKSLKNLYTLCIKQMMVEIGHILREYFPGDQVLLIHDHGNWDTAAQEAYNLMVDDDRWEPRKLFAGISALTWQQSVGLQAADMIAYEVFREVKAGGIHTDHERRPAIRAFEKQRIPVSAQFMNLETIQALHDVMEASGNHLGLKKGSLT